MYIAPGQGQTTPWGQMLMSTESPYHFAHLLQVLKRSPGQGQATPWGQNFDVNKNSLSLFSHLLLV